MYVQFQAGKSRLFRALPGGNQPSLMANRSIARKARKKYGAAWKNVVAGSRLSSQLPRRQATRAPSRVPATKLSTVAVPTRPSVHGSAPRITVVTGTRPLLVDVPRLPCTRLFQ